MEAQVLIGLVRWVVWDGGAHEVYSVLHLSSKSGVLRPVLCTLFCLPLCKEGTGDRAFLVINGEVCPFAEGGYLICLQFEVLYGVGDDG